MSSRSFMDAIRSVAFKASLEEGVKDKTADGMTKDAKRLADDLHKVTDSGVKHLVQKDSESKDYEKMFKPDIKKATARRADLEPGRDTDKYAEYNEDVQLEAKKLSKKDDDKTGDNPDNEDATGPITNEEKHKNGCECKDCKKTVKEALMKPKGYNPMTGTGGTKPAGTVYNPLTGTGGVKDARRASGDVAPARPGMNMRAISRQGADLLAKRNPTDSNFPDKKPAVKPAAPVSPTTGAGRPNVNPNNSARKIKAPGSETAAAAGSSTNPAERNIKYTGPNTPKPGLAKPHGSTQQPYGMKTPLQKPGGSTQQPYGMKTPKPGTPPKPTPKPSTDSPGSATPPVKQAPGDAKPPVRNKPPVRQAPGGTQKKMAPPAGIPRTDGTRNNDVGPSAKPRGGVTTDKTIIQQNKPRAKAPAGTNPLRSHYEIEWNGNSYVMNEAQIQALGTFIEKYGQVNEVITASTSKDEIIHDFVHSKNKKFEGKSKEKRIKQALAAYRAKHGK